MCSDWGGPGLLWRVEGLMGAVVSPKPNSNMCSEALLDGAPRQDRRFWTKLQSYGQSRAAGCHALREVPRLGLAEASFPKTSWPGCSEAPRGWAAGLACAQGGGLMLSSTSESLASKGMTQMLITASCISLLEYFPRTEARTCFAGLTRSPDPREGLETTVGLAGLRLLPVRLRFSSSQPSRAQTLLDKARSSGRGKGGAHSPTLPSLPGWK